MVNGGRRKEDSIVLSMDKEKNSTISPLLHTYTQIYSTLIWVIFAICILPYCWAAPRRPASLVVAQPPDRRAQRQRRRHQWFTGRGSYMKGPGATPTVCSRR